MFIGSVPSGDAPHRLDTSSGCVLPRLWLPPPFDDVLVELAICEELTDEEIVLLAETRTARAFMLLARVAGIFD